MIRFTTFVRAGLLFAVLGCIATTPLLAQDTAGAGAETAPEMTTPGANEADRPSNNIVGESRDEGQNQDKTNDTEMGRAGSQSVPPGSAVNDDTPTAGIPPSGVPRAQQEEAQTGDLQGVNGASVPNVNDSSSNQQLMEEETSANPTGPGTRSAFSSEAWLPILIIGGVVTMVALWLLTQFYRNKKRE